MSFSVRASEIAEFSVVSERLGWGDVHVFRTDSHSTALGPDQWDALEEDGIRLVSLGNKDICGLTRSGLVCHFLWMCACTDTTVGWERLSFYKVALANAGMTFVEPVKSWIECGEIDVVGMEVTESQFIKLTDFCAAFCIEQAIPLGPFIALAKSQLYGSPVGHETFDQAFEEFLINLSNYSWS